MGGGGPLDHIGENLEQTFNSEKRLGALEIDNNRFPTVWAQTWVMGQVLDLWSPPGASCPRHACGSRLRERGGGPRDLRLGGAASSWGALSSRMPCLVQITEVLCYAQSLFYFYYSGINFPKQTFDNAEMKTGW